MPNLQVEELEPRQLLNGTGFSPRPPPAQPVAAGAFAGRVDERAPSVDLGGGHAGPVRHGGPGEGGAEVGAPQVIVSSYTGGRAWEATGPHATAYADHERWSPRGTSGFIDSRSESTPFAGATNGAGREGAVTRTDTTGSGITRVGAGLPSGGPDAAGGAETARTTSGSTPPTMPEVVDSGSGADVASAEPVAGTPAGRPNLQPPPALDSLVAAVGFLVDVQGLAAARPPVGAVREGEGLSYGPDPLLRRYQPPSPGAAAAPTAGVPDGGRAEEGPVLPPPQVSGVLTALPPFNLSALELGLQRFLEQLEGMGQRLTGPGEGTGLRLWLVAGGAAAAACEIARRQLRQPDGKLAPALPGSPLDPYFAG
jgi:hypothetical protein